MIIAIDGHSSCGKSTIAKALANKLGIAYVDTGAMYRAITLYLLQNKIDIENEKEVNQALQKIDIHIKNEDGKNEIFLNNQNVTDQIRTPEINNKVSFVSILPEVRNKLVSLQRAMATQSLVMDGRDIGSVVFPQADLKFFVTADLETRAKRRLLELSNNGHQSLTLQEIAENLALRDKIDSSRDISPLVRLPEAILIDTSNLSPSDQLELVFNIVTGKFHN